MERFPKLKDPKIMEKFLSQKWVLKSTSENERIINTSLPFYDEDKYHLLGEGWDTKLMDYDESVIEKQIDEIYNKEKKEKFS